MPSGYKPSPLSYGSPRASPFRRPESPSSPLANRQTTPTPSPTKPPGVGPSIHTPSRFSNATPTQDSQARTPRWQPSTASTAIASQSLGSPVQMSSRAPPVTSHQSVSHGNALSQLQPAQVRVLRDGFQILDRDSDGVVNREDVADMLAQLGLPANPSDISPFFPPGGPQTLTLAAFLNSIATTLAALSPSSELLSAFSAFDDDDSGQIDVAELRDALLHTAPEDGERGLTPGEVDKIIAGFSGRRAFSKSSMGLGAHRGKGEVFRYQDFVNSINGSNAAAEQQADEAPES
ncbi:EF-hand [Xylariaceae sp. FL1019]|nr:EF-hand [Xylariaceae sp. FL1019]